MRIRGRTSTGTVTASAEGSPAPPPRDPFRHETQRPGACSWGEQRRESVLAAHRETAASATGAGSPLQTTSLAEYEAIEASNATPADVRVSRLLIAGGPSDLHRTIYAASTRRPRRKNSSERHANSIEALIGMRGTA